MKRKIRWTYFSSSRKSAVLNILFILKNKSGNLVSCCITTSGKLFVWGEAACVTYLSGNAFVPFEIQPPGDLVKHHLSIDMLAMDSRGVAATLMSKKNRLLLSWKSINQSETSRRRILGRKLVADYYYYQGEQPASKSGRFLPTVCDQFWNKNQIGMYKTEIGCLLDWSLCLFLKLYGTRIWWRSMQIGVER